MRCERTAAASEATGVAIARALRQGAQTLSEAGVEPALLDAEVLLCYLLDVGREHLYANPQRRLDQSLVGRYGELIRRRASCEPVAYITGSKEFWSLDLLVTPDVLIPRPETELLVEVCLNREISAPCSMRFAPCALRVLELGTGSGAIAIALAKAMPGAEIAATDVSAPSLAVARTNAARHGVSTIEFCHGELFGAVAAERCFDFIVANPPYVRSSELRTLPADIRNWEPLIALDGGLEGVDYYRSIAAAAHHYLAGGGYVVLEIGADMAANVSQLFSEAARYGPAAIYQDYTGRDRVFAARKLCT
jgi:release factor glutamine methyltransferase